MRQNHINNKQYLRGELLEDNMYKDPMDQFFLWFKEAVSENAKDVNSMILATTSQELTPSLRVVLLKNISTLGFSFFTDYNSRKALEISENPKASLLFFWSELERQVRIEGKVKKLTPEESDEYFNERDYGSKIAALISQQSTRWLSRNELDDKFKLYFDKHKDEKIKRPVHWGGYILIPEKFEFWQGREHRLNDRIVYDLVDQKWQRYRIAP
jgi:pyridoxamine 5'-phosphate oxidase